MGTLLLFNIQDEKKRTAIRLLSMRLKLQWRDVPPDRQGLTLEKLLAGEKDEKPVGEPFEDEMMVMHGLSSESMNTLLDSMRQNGCAVRLKCVVTKANIGWTAARLHREIEAEDRAMRAKRKGVHT